MLFKRFESKGLAHYSYLIGDGGRAVVIDPRRDCDVYLEAATLEGLRITHILETHHIPERLDEVLRDQPIYIFCGSGLRSMIAASLLRRAGRENLTVVLGGLAGWSSTTCPLE
jgi:hydroxyacylglutathione hydrolase